MERKRKRQDVFCRYTKTVDDFTFSRNNKQGRVRRKWNVGGICGLFCEFETYSPLTSSPDQKDCITLLVSKVFERPVSNMIGKTK